MARPWCSTNFEQAQIGRSYSVYVQLHVYTVAFLVKTICTVVLQMGIFSASIMVSGRKRVWFTVDVSLSSQATTSFPQLETSFLLLVDLSLTISG